MKCTEIRLFLEFCTIAQDISEKKSQRIKGSDYNSWDKFDADEECKKMDLEQEIKEESTKKIEEIQLKENKKMSIEELAIQSLGDIGTPLTCYPSTIQFRFENKKFQI